MSEKVIEIVCNICGSSEYELISKRGHLGLPVNVVICKKCGLTYLNPRWSKKRYQHFYEQEYDRYYRPNLKDNLPAKETSTNTIYDRLFSLKVLPDSISHVLDIGAGSGTNLDYFKKKYSKGKFYAIESSVLGQELLEKKGITLLAQDVDENWESNAPKFDLIIMRHVLEHFLDPLTILRKVRGCLSEGGILYLAVPNAFNPSRPLQGFWFRTVHTYYFSKYSLQNLLAISKMTSIALREGDDRNPTEIFLAAKSEKKDIKPKWGDRAFQTQRDFFLKRMSTENYTLYKIKSMIDFYFPGLTRLKKRIFG